jgi:ABC-type transport system involved in multi-copper enzyme maturation permease subunit
VLVLLIVGGTFGLGYGLSFWLYQGAQGGVTRLGNIADQELLNLLPGGLALQLVNWPLTIGGPLMLILGVLVAGSEYGWGTLKTVLTRRPSRSAVFGSKVLTLGVVVTLIVLVFFALAAATSTLVAQREGEVARQASAPAIAARINQVVPFGEGFAERHGAAIAEALPRSLHWPPMRELGTALGAAWLILLLHAVLGLFLGTITRGTAFAIGLGLAWLVVVEPQIWERAAYDTSFRTISRWTLTENMQHLAEPIFSTVPALGDAPTIVFGNPNQLQAALVLPAYTLLFIVLGALVFHRRDVT